MKKIEHILIDLERSKGWLARKAEISPGTLSNILSGKSNPTLDVALKIAFVLNVKVEDIWGYRIEDWKKENSVEGK